MKKKLTRKQITKKLDEAFSKYIRLRDEEYGCITCGKLLTFKELQCGHFFSRSHLHTRWDEDNCHAQCYRCNCILHGNYINYTKYMIDRYGREFVDELEKKSMLIDKISTDTLLTMLEHYKSLTS
jgi:5-methylcytosine-specific restriction endonuclease McrA